MYVERDLIIVLGTPAKNQDQLAALLDGLPNLGLELEPHWYGLGGKWQTELKLATRRDLALLPLLIAEVRDRNGWDIGVFPNNEPKWRQECGFGVACQHAYSLANDPAAFWEGIARGTLWFQK